MCWSCSEFTTVSMTDWLRKGLVSECLTQQVECTHGSCQWWRFKYKVCKQLGKLFHVGGCLGLLEYISCDLLLKHNYCMNTLFFVSCFNCTRSSWVIAWWLWNGDVNSDKLTESGESTQKPEVWKSARCTTLSCNHKLLWPLIPTAVSQFTVVCTSVVDI